MEMGEVKGLIFIVNLKTYIMKNSDQSKKIEGLENQKVNSDKIQGGGVGPEPFVLTKDLESKLEPAENKSVGASSENKAFVKKPRANKNRPF